MVAEAKGEDGLTVRQRLFVTEYLVDLNASQAAVRAGYKEDNANVVGPRLLTKPAVQALISEAQHKRAARVEVTADRVLQELALVAFSDLGELMDFTGGEARIDFSRIKDGSLRVVSEITQDEYVEGRGDDAQRVKRTKVKFYDKLRALELVGKHLGMFSDKVELTGKDGGPIQVEGLGISGLLQHARTIEYQPIRPVTHDVESETD